MKRIQECMRAHVEAPRGNTACESEHVCSEQDEALVREVGGHKDGYLACGSGMHVYLLSPSIPTLNSGCLY